MRRLSCCLGLICVVALPAWGDVAPQRPLLTILPWSLDRGDWEIGVGALRRDEVSPPFFAHEPGTRRSEWRLALVDATLGLGGGGEMQVRFGAQQFHEAAGESRTGIDDARIAFTYRLPVGGAGETLATALRFEVKLPNAPNDDRLGTDETDILMLGAVGQRRERWGWAGNLGFGILGDPTEAAVQDDVLLFGAAAWFAPWRRDSRQLLFEVNGLAASRFGNDFRLARAGIRIGRRFPFDLSLRRGLTSPSEDWGLEAGVTLIRYATPRSRGHLVAFQGE